MHRRRASPQLGPQLLKLPGQRGLQSCSVGQGWQMPAPGASHSQLRAPRALPQTLQTSSVLFGEDEGLGRAARGKKMQEHDRVPWTLGPAVC